MKIDMSDARKEAERRWREPRYDHDPIAMFTQGAAWAQRTSLPDPMNDPRGTLYVAPNGDAYRHDGTVGLMGMSAKPYLKTLSVSGYMGVETELPEGSVVVWRPEATE